MLYELSRDISGVDNLVLSQREFIRQGCLSKFSQRKGYQQRMFFLVSCAQIFKIMHCNRQSKYANKGLVFRYTSLFWPIGSHIPCSWTVTAQQCHH